jgi:ankyrin repeat protein
MLDFGVDVESHGSDGMAPLHVVALAGNVEKAKLLLAYGADVNAEYRPGASPLFIAAARQRKELCGLLLAQGAQLGFHAACALGKRAEAEAMLARDPTLASSRDVLLERTALAWAAQGGDTGLVELLLAHGARVHAFSSRMARHGLRHDYKTRETALYVAVHSADPAMTRLLLEKGADVNARTGKGETALHLARDSRIARLLLDSGLNLDREARASLLRGAVHEPELFETLLVVTPREELTGDFGEILLEAAVEKNQLKAARLLEEHGARVNIFAACLLGRNDRVAALLSENPELLRARRERNQNPRELLSIAARRGHLDLVKLLRSKGAPLTVLDKPDLSPTDAAARGGHADIVEFLLSEGADVNERDFNAATPLHHAAEGGNPDVVKLLIERGADVNLRRISRDTPLHVAARRGAVEVARCLIQHGSRVDVRDRYNATALHIAAGAGKLEMARLLLELGADVNARDRLGRTPLECASPHDADILPPDLLDNPERRAVAGLLREHDRKR